jgi:hypothetical protein
VNTPSTIQAGDTITWSECLSEYPATDGWTLKHRLAGPSIIDITSTASGPDHLISISAATAMAYTPGFYRWTAYVDNGTDIHTVGSGTLTIVRDLRQITGSYEGRSHGRRVYEALQAAIEGRATKEQEEMSVNGRAIRYLDPAKLRQEMLRWKLIADAEDRADRIARGEKVGGRTILIRFKNP